MGRKVAQRLSTVSRYRVAKWLEGALYNGAGPAHAMTRDSDTLSPNLELRIQGSPVSDPLAAMDQRAADWSKIWITSQDEWAHLGRVYLAARHEASHHPYHPVYEAKDIRRIILSTNVAKGYGADQVSAGFLRYLPDEAYEEIKDLFHQMDTLILPPLQMVQTIIALIAKPDGGERPIGLLSFLYRVYMNFHRVEVEE